jgi:hypothetical protein
MQTVPRLIADNLGSGNEALKRVPLWIHTEAPGKRIRLRRVYQFWSY